MLSVAILVLQLTTIESNSKCSSEPSQVEYHLMENCFRSKLGIAAKANPSSLASCQRLGVEKRGLALNWNPLETRSEGQVEYTCEILKCAEVDGGASLVNDTRYDYYSLFAKPIPHENATCVPGTGLVFLVTKKLNYSQAVHECRNITAVPADITSEQRTDAFAQVLSGAGIDAAFVGMRRKKGSSFISVKGDSLDCITYRAWAPGHPRRYRDQFDCVLITRQKTWLSASCKKAYPVLCELIPGGPYKLGSLFASKVKNDTSVEATDD